VTDKDRQIRMQEAYINELETNNKILQDKIKALSKQANNETTKETKAVKAGNDISFADRYISDIPSLKEKVLDLQKKKRVIKPNQKEQEIVPVGNIKIKRIKRKPDDVEEADIETRNLDPRFQAMRLFGPLKYDSLDIFGQACSNQNYILANCMGKPQRTNKQVLKQCLDRFRDNNITFYDLRKEQYNLRTQTPLSGQGLLYRLTKAIYWYGTDEEKAMFNF
tara:strand:- start:32 stop:697 length:666 start_codon:yes stop_codon:yes gene_type:complete